jgi:hypothetical protein
MESIISSNNFKINRTLDAIDKKTSRKDFNKKNKFMKYIKINSYLNEYNYFFKNAIKMNKLRKEKYKENQIKMK